MRPRAARSASPGPPRRRLPPLLLGPLLLGLGLFAGPGPVASAEEGARTVTGAAMDMKGHPIRGARVLLRGSERAGAPTAGVTSGDPILTDGEGAFAWEAPKAGDYRLHISARGFQPVEKEVTTGGPECLVLLSPLLEIRGVILDEATKEPVKGVPVTATAEGTLDLGFLGRQVLSGADGTFVVGGLVKGKYSVEVGIGLGDGRDDYAPRTVAGVTAGTRELRIEVARGRAIAGRVVDEDGHPVAGKVVSLEPLPAAVVDDVWIPGPFFSRSMRTGPDGAFRLEGLPPGTYSVHAGGGSPPEDAYFHWARHDIPAGKEDLEIRLRRGTSIRGRVLDEAGKPVDLGVRYRERVSVQVRREGEVPADDPTRDARPSPEGGGLQSMMDGPRWEHAWFLDGGRFEMRLAVPGATYEIRARHEDGREGRAAGIAAGTEDAEVRLLPGKAIRGRLLESDGRPVPAGLVVRAAVWNPHRGVPSAETDAEGRFRIENLHGEGIELMAGGGTTEYLETRLGGPWKPGDDVGDVRLRRGQILEGRIVDRRRVPRGSAVSITASAGETEGGSPVAADGTFRIRCLPPGPVLLSLWVEHVEVDGATEGTLVDAGSAVVPASGVEVILE